MAVTANQAILGVTFTLTVTNAVVKRTGYGGYHGAPSFLRSEHKAFVPILLLQLL